MLLNIFLWITLALVVLLAGGWLMVKTGLFLRIAENSSRGIYERLSDEEKIKFDKIVENEGLDHKPGQDLALASGTPALST